MRTEWILPAVGMGSGILLLLLFGGFWAGLRRRRLHLKGAGEWMNALGFGLLPALAVYKAFEPYTPVGSAGREVFDPLPEADWVTANGRFVPGRIEMILLLAAFIGLCLWMMIRKRDLGSHGDVMGISLTLWAGIRTVTEGFRAESQLDLGSWRVIYLACLAASLLWMMLWTGKRQKRIKNTSQTVLYWFVWVICCAALWTTISGTLSVGSEIGDLAVVTGCAAARAAASLATGAESWRE